MSRHRDTIDWQAGVELPARSFPPLTRTTLALFAGGSGDHNPLHLDPEFARAAGLPDVIGHGMLTMALLGRYLTGLVPQSAIRSLDARFLSMSQVGDAISCRGKVVEVAPSSSGSLATLELSAVNGAGAVLVSGAAKVAVRP